MHADEMLNPSPQRPSVPLIFDLSVRKDRDQIQKLLDEKNIQHTTDEYTSQLRELHAISNPSIALTPEFENSFNAYLKERIASQPLQEQGTWVYFPWLYSISHILDDVDFQKVRTARNKNLITEEEQKKFYDATIGIAGLSVGNSVALAIVLQGGARHIKLADHDTLELSNLNRIRSGIESLGIPKVEMTARQIYLLNPYAEVEVFPEGLTDRNIGKFFEGLDIVIDEIDNLAMKYRIREEAKKRRIPVVTAVDSDHSSVVDVERYDLDPSLKFFKGRLGSVTYEKLKALDKFNTGRIIVKLIGSENMTPRILKSLDELGQEIISWPQLASTALINGSFLAYLTYKIANNLPVVSERSVYSMDKSFDPTYDSAESIKARENALQQVKKHLQ